MKAMLLVAALIAFAQDPAQPNLPNLLSRVAEEAEILQQNTRLFTCVYNARQYSVVKDLHCLSNQFQRDFHSPELTADLYFSLSVGWWAQMESNHRPHPYQGCALAI